MAGAYVASPDLAYTLLVTGPTTMLAGAGIAMTASFRYKGWSRTVEPSNRNITWTATLDGTPITLRVPGGAFAGNAVSAAIDSGSFWESSVTLEFDDIGSSSDQIIIVTGSAAIEGVDVTDFISATVLDYSLVLSGPSSRFFSGASDCTVILLANSVSKTAEPISKTITFTATLDGAPLNLRFTGDSTYLSSISSPVADSDGFWQTSISIEWEVTFADDDKIIELTAQGAIAGLSVSDTLNITVVGDWKIFYTLKSDCSQRATPINSSDSWATSIRYKQYTEGGGVRWWKTFQNIMNFISFSEPHWEPQFAEFGEAGSEPDNITVVQTIPEWDGILGTGTAVITMVIGPIINSDTYRFDAYNQLFGPAGLGNIFFTHSIIIKDKNGDVLNSLEEIGPHKTAGNYDPELDVDASGNVTIIKST